MNSRSADKIVFTSYDDLFGENQKAEAGESVVSLPLSRLHSFKNHPFHVIDDEKMQETVKSVRQYGVLVPAIVREDEVRGDYEIIAGHRRKRACELAGHTEMPVIVRKVTDDEAVDSFEYLSRMEGIIPAVESAHAVAYARKIAPSLKPDQIIVVNLSGRGDKDVAAIARYRGVQIYE